MKWLTKFPPGTLILREADCGRGLFTTKDPVLWKSYLLDLGHLCAEAWNDDLPEEDRAWAAPYRQKFSRWIDDAGYPTAGQRDAGALPRHSVGGDPAPPWPMLLEAVKSALYARLEIAKQIRPVTEERAVEDPTSRLHKSYLWRMLTSDDTADEHRAEALRAFRRGFRIGRTGKPRTLTRPIPPVLKPPFGWGAAPELPGPSAARERAIKALPAPEHREALAAREQELQALYATAWREDVPEEDQIWAAMYRDTCTMWINSRRRNALAQSAYEGYLQSSDGRFNGEPAPRWSSLSYLASEPWCSFVDRVEEAPEGESEPATAAAAAREYWDTLYKEAPPWDSDPAQAHWLAAVRAARRKAQADDDVPPGMGQ
ncbi:hypothetical protein WMF37_47130 [Sorangium sp. So ce291]|uniref:hypothetical protein n=1 Tax=Sorangium sp. So ce291 TaxID=3133294 RepID=UPI003F5FF12D